MLHPIIKSKWLNALRSGKFKQATGQLKRDDNYCCLGVLCKITGNECNRDMYSGYPKQDEEEEAIDFMGIPGSVIDELAKKNDSGSSFGDIANWIEKSL